MLYYLKDDCFYISQDPLVKLKGFEITEEEYNQRQAEINEELKKQERAEKEAQLRALMLELYPPEEG